MSNILYGRLAKNQIRARTVQNVLNISLGMSGIGTGTIPWGTKTTTSAGTRGQVYQDDDYTYFCDTTGIEGEGHWKSIPKAVRS